MPIPGEMLLGCVGFTFILRWRRAVG